MNCANVAASVCRLPKRTPMGDCAHCLSGSIPASRLDGSHLNPQREVNPCC